MWSEMESAPAIVQPSSFWTELNDLNLRQLDEAGLAHFKRTVNQNYFGWIPHTVRDEQLLAVLRGWLRRPTPAVLSARLGDVSNLQAGADRSNPFAHRRARFIHAAFLALLWENVRRIDRLGMLDHLDEPELGDPVTATYRGRQISQDLCNSVHELYSMVDELPGGELGANGVLELGSGYGRVAWAFLRQFPGVRYILCDIPPALGVAQWYLTSLFPERRSFRFRHFESHAEVADELAEAEIAFLTPNQLELLDPLDVGLFVNISSLHEMRPEQIAHYLGQVDRHCAGSFYMKQWKRWSNPEDRVVIRREDYPIPQRWETVYSRDHPIQTAFFEALYRVPGA
jgi:putative sugar O-methyltransferase